MIENKFKGFGVALAALIVLAVPGAAHANLLTNGSFEDGFNGWTVAGVSDDGYPPVVIPYNSNSSYPNGAFGEPIPNDDATGNPGFDPVGDYAAYFVADLAHPQTLSQLVSIVDGTSYTFGFDVYVPQNGANNANDADFSAIVGGFQFASFSASAMPVQDWIHYSSTGTANGSGLVDFIFTYNSYGIPAKDFVIDRVYFAETSVPEPATLALFGLGLAGIGFARRKKA